MEEQKRRAEADKLAAITALEQRSREFMREKEEKRRLETRIANMQSQLLIGGSKLEDTPVFRWAAFHSTSPQGWVATLQLCSVTRWRTAVCRGFCLACVTRQISERLQALQRSLWDTWAEQ